MNKDIVIIGSGLSALFVLKQISDRQVSSLRIEVNDTIGGTFEILKDTESSFDFNNEKLDFKSLLDNINELSLSTDIDIWTQSYVRNIIKENDAFYLDVITKEGIKNVKAKQVVMATGYRERTINQAFIEGSRPAGIMSALECIYYINELDVIPSRKCVIYGTHNLAFLAAKALIDRGIEVIGIYDENDKVAASNEIYNSFTEKYDTKIYLSHKIKKVVGEDRLVEIIIEDLNNLNSETTISCDSLILALGKIPVNELSETMGAKISLWTKGPIVDQNNMTTIDGLYSIGHSLCSFNSIEHIHSNSCQTALNLFKYKKQERTLVEVNFDENILYVVPEMIDIKDSVKSFNFYFRPANTLINKQLKFYIDGSEVLSRKYDSLSKSEMEKVVVDIKNFNIVESSNIIVRIE